MIKQAVNSKISRLIGKGENRRLNISKEIIRKMHRLAKLTGETKKLSSEIDQYFMEKGFDIDELRCGNGRSLEELECGNDITDIFCIDAKNNFSDKSMWNTHFIRVR
jgi:hypothetical protein